MIFNRNYNNFLLLVSFLFMMVTPTQSGEHESVYTVDVSIPEYDPGNSEHFLISSKADWIHINDSDKRFFYVEPNVNYGYAYIAADGTANAKKYISLYNGNDTHPAKLSSAEQANVQLVFNNANYWVVDRMSSFNHSATDDYCIRVEGASANIVLNRLYLTNFYNGIIIRGTLNHPYTNNITVQNCRLDAMSAAGLNDDRVAIFLTGENWNIDRTLVNTKILNNEIRNCNDGIQPVSRPQDGQLVDYPGTIIDFNHIYIDSAIYSDGNGNHDPNGLYAWAENAIDLKGGSNDPDNPMILTNNYFWGYRWTDPNGGGSGDPGAAMVIHYNVKNVIVENNVVFDSNRGIVAGDPGGLAFSVEDASMKGNIFYDLGHNPEGQLAWALYYYESKNLAFENNTIVGVNKQSRWFSNNNDEVNMSVKCNAIINSYEMVQTRAATTIVESNTFYNTSMQDAGDGISYANASDAHMADLTFTTDNYTNSPREITLPGVVTTELSPHAGGCMALPGEATGPSPSDTTEDILTDVRLRWTARNGATSHDVYFGETNPPPFIQNQDSATYTPDHLSNNTTYYWRIDEKNETGIAEGKVWSFTTVDSMVNTNVDLSSLTVSAKFSVDCYPIPSNSYIYLRFSIPGDGRVIIRIYNLMGEEIDEVANSFYTLGSHVVVWDSSHTLRGKISGEQQLYMYQAQFEDQVRNGKIILAE